jgi:hypothetical protein
MDQCEKNYKTLFTKVFHIFVYLTILKLQYFLNKHTPNILLHTLYPKRNSNELYKIKKSLLVPTLYSMFSMQGNMNFCYLNNFSKENAY